MRRGRHPVARGLFWGPVYRVLPGQSGVQLGGTGAQRPDPVAPPEQVLHVGLDPIARLRGSSQFDESEGELLSEPEDAGLFGFADEPAWT